MSSTTEARTITLQSKDGENFEVAREVAMELGPVKSFLEETDPSSADDKMIPLPNVHSVVLGSIIKYCKKQVDFNARSAPASERKEYDREFLKGLTNEQAKEMTAAANYLDVKGLLEVLLQGVADRIKNRSVEYVRAFFGIENDFTPEEEAKHRNEHPWAFEGVDPDD